GLVIEAQRTRGNRQRPYCGIDGERGGVAGHAACAIADYNSELRPVIRRGRGWRCVARRGRPADGRPILPPLIAERSGARAFGGECRSEERRGGQEGRVW